MTRSILFLRLRDSGHAAHVVLQHIIRLFGVPRDRGELSVVLFEWSLIEQVALLSHVILRIVWAHGRPWFCSPHLSQIPTRIIVHPHTR